MRFHPEHLDNALDREGGAYALPCPQADLKHAVKQALLKGNHVILITACSGGNEIVDRLGPDAEDVTVIDWHSYQARSIVGVEEEDNVLLCARDLVNVNMAVNKAVKMTGDRGKRVMMVDALPAMVNLFGKDKAYSFLSKHIAKLTAKSIKSFFLAPADFFDDHGNQTITGLLESLPDTPPAPERPERRYDKVISRVIDRLGLDRERLGPEFREFGIWLCYECGAFVDREARECPTCHAPVELVIHTDESIMDIDDIVSRCPECGVPMRLDADMCSVCGRVFSGDDKENMLGQGLVDVVEDVLEHEVMFMVCPECGSFVSRSGEECGLCGASIDRRTARQVDSDQAAEELSGMLVNELELDHDLESSFAERSFVMCPECSASVDRSKDRCGICGTYLGSEEDRALTVIEEPEGKGPDKTETDGYWYRDESELYICPMCGSFIPGDADSCDVCGVAFEEGGEEEAGHIETVHCPGCQTVIPADSVNCPGCGTPLEEAEADGHWYKERKGLFMCPNCGSFLPDDAARCASCGVEFEGDDDEVSEEAREPVCQECGAVMAGDEDKCPVCGNENDLDGFWFRKQKGLFMCPGCGTFLAGDASRCHSCGIVFEGEGEMAPEEPACPHCQAPLGPDQERCSDCGFDFTRPAPDDESAGELFMCPGCGAFISASASECINCGLGFDQAEDDLEQNSFPCPGCGSLIGTGADACPNCGTVFREELSEKAEKELEDLDRMLVMEGDLPEQGTRDAVDSEISELEDMLVSAAEEPPETDADSEIRALEDILVSAAEEPPETDADSEIRALEDMLVSVDQGAIDEELDALDLEIDEISDMLVSGKEGMGALDPAELREAEEISDMLVELESMDSDLKNGLRGPGERKQGLTNGLTNGMVNGTGLTNGLTNGMTNGLTNGMTNGLTNGMTNGLTNGMTNGLTNGMTNGLTNGMTNGLATDIESKRVGPGRRRRRQSRMYRLAFVVVLIAMISILPALAGMFDTAPSQPFHIDGNFADWDDIVRFHDSLSGTPENPDIDILEAGAVFEPGAIYAFMEFDGTALRGRDGGVDSVLGFIDLDGNPGTGYSIQGLGADLVLDVHGWDGVDRGSRCLVFDHSRDPTDWNGFSHFANAPAAAADSGLEVKIPVPRNSDHSVEDAVMMVIASDASGNMDVGNFIISGSGDSADMRVEDMGPEILQVGQDTPLLRLSIRAAGGVLEFTGLDFRLMGTAGPDDIGAMGIIHDINGNGLADPGEEMASNMTLQNDGVGFLELASPLEIGSNEYQDFIVTMELASGSQGRTAGIRPDGIRGHRTLVQGHSSLHNCGLPAGMEVDGAFGDWASIPGTADAPGDVVSMTASRYYNGNADISEARIAIDADLFVYMGVNGDMLGGAGMPTVRTRPPPPSNTNTTTYADTDRDTVPDYLDPLPKDFDNNGVNDSMENGDRDNDGILDHDMGGTDLWLNTTIPGNYAPGYAGKEISVYIGPVAVRENHGYDTAYVLVDSDGDPMTGIMMKGAVGVEHVVVVQGKYCKVFSAELFELAPGGQNPWALKENISAAAGPGCLELAIAPASLGIVDGSNYTVYAAMEDWKGQEDVLDRPLDPGNITVMAPLSTRAGTGHDPMAPKPKIDLTKTVDKDIAAPGDVLMYTITYSNSRAPAYDVWLNETYPAGTTFLNATPPPTIGDGTWYIGTLADGESGTMFINVTIDASVANNTVLTNTVDMTYTDGGFWPAGSASADAETTVIIVPELEPVMGILLMAGIFISGKRLRGKE